MANLGQVYSKPKEPTKITTGPEVAEAARLAEIARIAELDRQDKSIAKGGIAGKQLLQERQEAALPRLNSKLAGEHQAGAYIGQSSEQAPKVVTVPVPVKIEPREIPKVADKAATVVEEVEDTPAVAPVSKPQPWERMYSPAQAGGTTGARKEEPRDFAGYLGSLFKGSGDVLGNIYKELQRHEAMREQANGISGAMDNLPDVRALNQANLEKKQQLDQANAEFLRDIEERKLTNEAKAREAQQQLAALWQAYQINSGNRTLDISQQNATTNRMGAEAQRDAIRRGQVNNAAQAYSGLVD